MNIRKPIDYSTMYAALNTLMASPLSQMELYCEIGKLVSAMPVKGAAVAAAEYLSKTHPGASGFPLGTCAGCGIFTELMRTLRRR